MVKMLANLHNVDYEKVGLQTLENPEIIPKDKLVDGKNNGIYLNKESLPEMDFIINWLNKYIPKKSDISIVHGDYRIGNLMYDINLKSIKAVLDWELSTIGSIS